MNKSVKSVENELTDNHLEPINDIEEYIKARAFESMEILLNTGSVKKDGSDGRDKYKASSDWLKAHAIPRPYKHFEGKIGKSLSWKNGETVTIKDINYKLQSIVSNDAKSSTWYVLIEEV